MAIEVVGVPTSAGAHHAGQDPAPAALREHGLLDRLPAGGLVVHDRGDVAGEVVRRDPAAASTSTRTTRPRCSSGGAPSTSITARSPHIRWGPCTGSARPSSRCPASAR